ncbi:MAG: sulfotransferase family protein [Planctomycetaceae bacterium]
MSRPIDRQTEARRILAGQRPRRPSPRTILRATAVACGVGHLVGIGNKLPGIVVVGAMRAGTTSLFSLLAAHPQVAAAFHKEVHYFDLRFHLGTNWYRHQFRRPRTAVRRRAIGLESSPYYLFDPRVPARMAAIMPDVKLVFLLRDPVERAFSHYRKNLRDGREPLSFAEALAAEDERLAGEEERMLHDPGYVSRLHQYYSYAARGRYAEQLIRWRRHFPVPQMLVVDAARLFASPGAVLAQLFAFAELEPWVPRQFVSLNAGQVGMPLDPDTASGLAARFAPHERQLAALIGWCPSKTCQATAVVRAEAA